jgi:NAD(P)-dependent dehydrogenase (short-subunit alcohol dehydrogenase family)
MQELEGKVAVVTGAASGIGRAMAEVFAAQRMRLVLADIEEPALSSAASELRQAGAAVLPFRLDVSKPAEVDALADAAYREYGAVHVLCNNAGVGGQGGPAWVGSLENWDWVLGVNLFGVIHGVHSFVPRMVAGGQEGHVVNTASIAGLISGAMIAPYFVSKHEVVALSETLSVDLQLTGARLGVSVLCPGFVKTRIAESDRNRPESLGPSPLASDQMRQMMKAMVDQGTEPSVIAAQVLDAIRQNRFWILTHLELDAVVRNRMDAILERRNPQFVPPQMPAASGG